jgi:PAS domain S-box-containing protein
MAGVNGRLIARRLPVRSTNGFELAQAGKKGEMPHPFGAVARDEDGRSATEWVAAVRALSRRRKIRTGGAVDWSWITGRTVRRRRSGRSALARKTTPRQASAGKPAPPKKPAAAPHGQGETGLLSSDGLLSRILDIADDAIISIDQNQRIIVFNQGAEKIFGYSAREVFDQPIDILLPEGFSAQHRRHVREFAQSPIAARRMGDRGDISGRRKDGSSFPAEASISKLDSGGRRIYTVILRDVTQRRVADEKIRASLREKEVLLQEIHHRVKNNLQVVSSLLSLQSRGVLDEDTRQKFKESQNRVHSMALIHEQLYQSPSLSQINYPQYIRQLGAHLFRSYRVSSSRIELQTRIDDLQLSVDIAVPCGLIINELVSNSLKYGFPNGRGGVIRIELHRQPNGRATLTVADDGVGLPEGVGFWNTQTLGLRLVGTLVKQLEGSIQVDRSQGTSVHVTFQLASPDEGEENDGVGPHHGSRR